MHARTAQHGRLGLGLGLGLGLCLGCYLRACTARYGTAGRGADLQRHDYLRSVESCVVVVELSRLAQVREELACSQDRKYT